MVLLFTASYPYGFGEEFIRAELEQLAESNLVFIFPETCADGDVRILPHGTLVNRPPHGRSLFVSKLKSVRFFKPGACVVDILRSLELRGLRFELKRLKTAGKAFKLHLKAAVMRQRIVSSGMADQPHTSYAYWGDSSALALALHTPYKFLVRFHGYDLYDNRSRSGQPATQRRIIEKAANVLAISEHGRTYLAERYPSHSGKIHLARLGVPVQSRFNPSPVDRFTIASVSRAVPVKRLHLIPQALKLLHDAGYKAYWIHVGDGPELSKIKCLAHELGLQNRVEFVGYLPQAEDGLYPFLRATPISWVINVSESEGLPVSLMEALSFGIPVIATDVGGNPELVIPSGGFLLPSNPTPDDIVRILVAAIDLDSDEALTCRRRTATTQRHMFNCLDSARQLSKYLG